MRNLDLDTFRRRNLSANAFPGQTQMPLPPERLSMEDLQGNTEELKLPTAPENVIAPTVGMNELPPRELLRQISQPTDLSQLSTPDLRTGRGTFSGQPYVLDQGPSTIGFGNLPTSSGRDPFPNTMPMASPQATTSKTIDPYGGITYTPQHRAMDMMYEMLMNKPERGKTPLWRKIMAGFMAASRDPDTGEAMQRFQSAPYDKKMADWQSRWNNVKDLATLERYENVNQRYITDSMLDALGRQRNLDLKELMALRKDVHWDVDENGNIIGITPDGNIIETGRKDNEFTDLQKVTYGLDPISIENKRTERALMISEATTKRGITLKNMDIDAQSTARRENREAAQALERLRQTGRLTLAERKAIQNASTVENSNQVKISWMNNAKAWLAQHPEDEKWLTFDPNVAYPELKSTDEYIDSQRGFLDRIGLGKTPPPDKTALEAHREEMRKAIFTEPRTLRQSSSQSGGTTATQTTPTAPTGKPKMLDLIDPNGKRVGTIPEGTRVPEGFTTKEP
jgi:hypothetical protein